MASHARRILVSVTIALTAVVASYTGNGVTTDYPTNFRFLDEDDLLVEQSTDDGVTWAPLVLDTDYSVDGAGDAEPGGTVVLAVELVAGWLLRITRQTPVVQPAALRNAGQSVFSPSVLELGLDRLTMIAQEQADRLDALESLSDLVTVTALGAGVNYVGALAASNPVENSFPLAIVVAGGSAAKYILWHIYATAADDNPMTEPPAVDWIPGPGLNQVTIRNISGLMPLINYTLKGLVLF